VHKIIIAMTRALCAVPAPTAAAKSHRADPRYEIVQVPRG
jgi:hypothetical protein